MNANASSTSGAITAVAGRNIILNAGNFSTSGNENLTATLGDINEAGAGIINGALLTSNSALGTTLNNANTITSFNASNSGAGIISLTNTVAPLTITGITQNGTGAVSVNNADMIAITRRIYAGSNNVALTAGGTVIESASGAVTAGLLTVNSVGGETLGGTNLINSFNATNTSGGAISLVNTAAPLAITGISQTGTGDVSVNNTGAIAITGTVTAGTNNVALTSSDTINESGSGLVNSGTLTTQSVNGETLNGANTDANFSAGNTTGGDIQLTNAAAPLDITGISEAGGNVLINNTGALTNTGAITTTANGNITLNASGTETLGAAITANGSGTVNLHATGISSDILVNANTSSTSGQSLQLQAAISS